MWLVMLVDYVEVCGWLFSCFFIMIVWMFFLSDEGKDDVKEGRKR